MYRDILGAKRQKLVKRRRECRKSVSGETCNNIGINDRYSRISRHIVRAQKILGVVRSAYLFEHLVVEYLGIDADSVYSVFARNSEFFFGYGIGSARLKRIFLKT